MLNLWQNDTHMANRELRIVSYNVIVDQLDARRTPALLELLCRCDADIIALQEVTPWFLEALRQQPWVRSYYSTLADATQRPPGGLVILSRLWIDRTVVHRMPSMEGRVAVVASVKVPIALDRVSTLDVCNLHLESPLQMGRVRALQIWMAVRMLKRSTDAVMLGDFNFGDEDRPDTAAIPPSYVDLWRTLRGDEPGLTWDMQRNTLAKQRAYPGEGSRRLDRILLRSTGWHGADIKMIGTGPIAEDKDVFPSDHFGLLSVLER